MNINVPDDLSQFVDQEFATGRYPSREAVVVAAIRRLKQEREDAIAGIKAGLADAEAGNVEPLEKVFADLVRNLRQPTANGVFGCCYRQGQG